jgi:hypothetical protein
MKEVKNVPDASQDTTPPNLVLLLAHLVQKVNIHQKGILSAILALWVPTKTSKDKPNVYLVKTELILIQQGALLASQPRKVLM